jgi:general stress protein YciG
MTLILVLSLGYCCKSGVLLLCCAVTVTDNITQKEIARQGGRDTNAWMNTEKCDSRCRYPTGRNGGAGEEGGAEHSFLMQETRVEVGTLLSSAAPTCVFW